MTEIIFRSEVQNVENLVKMKEHFERARQVLPGGVNSSTRYNKGIGLPLYVSHASGDKLFDLDGNEYIDMCCAHGAGLLGNAHPAIEAALKKAIELGMCNSLETVYHEQLAREICECIPCAEEVRFVNAGSEATMHLIRLCRAYTGRKKIIRMEGTFHGYHESIYIGGQVGPEQLAGNREHPVPESAGIPEEFASLIIPVPYNDVKAFDEAVEQYGDDVAMVILEPIVYNTSCIMPLPGYLEHLREVTREKGIVLFFDEVQTSFKTNLAGAQGFFGVIPDVCSFGKSVGGGLPLSGMCGKREIMECFKPVGNCQHSGTFNAPLPNVLCGLAFLNEARQDYFYKKIKDLGDFFYGGLESFIKENDLNMVIGYHGPQFNITFGRKTVPVRYEDSFTHDKNVMWRFCKDCVEHGVYFHDYGGGPSHHGFSIAHTKEDLEKVLDIVKEVLLGMHADGLC